MLTITMIDIIMDLISFKFWSGLSSTPQGPPTLCMGCSDGSVTDAISTKTSCYGPNDNLPYFLPNCMLCVHNRTFLFGASSIYSHRIF